MKNLEQFGKAKVKEELWEHYTKANKDTLLDSLVDASLAHPDGIIKEKIYPKVGGKEKLEQSKLLQERLLLALFAIATNTEFNKVCSGIANISEADLRYVKKRFMTPEALKYIIKKLINATIAIRDKQIWGELINSFMGLFIMPRMPKSKIILPIPMVKA